MPMETTPVQLAETITRRVASECGSLTAASLCFRIASNQRIFIESIRIALSRRPATFSPRPPYLRESALIQHCYKKAVSGRRVSRRRTRLQSSYLVADTSVSQHVLLFYLYDSVLPSIWPGNSPSASSVFRSPRKGNTIETRKPTKATTVNIRVDSSLLSFECFHPTGTLPTDGMKSMILILWRGLLLGLTALLYLLHELLRGARQASGAGIHVRR